ncbi:MAG: hexitol phosphatase HxpB [Candidatus Dormibacter sp.]
MTTSGVLTERGLRAVVFDMDGVLIDTEPVWRSVEIQVFGSLGLHLTEEDCRQTMGMRTGEMVRLWQARQPWSGASVADVIERIIGGVSEHVRARGIAMDGAVEAVRLVRSCGLRCAVASSSPRPLIDVVVARLDIGDDIDAVCSAEDEERGKPAPDVYLHAAELLGVPPTGCLAVEDSALGVLSARAAGMPCVAIPDAHTAQDPRLAVATLRLGTLRDLDRRRLESLNAAYFE